MKRRARLLRGVLVLGVIFSNLACAQNQVQTGGDLPERKKMGDLTPAPGQQLPVNSNVAVGKNGLAQQKPLSAAGSARKPQAQAQAATISSAGYTLGIADAIQIDVLKPEPLTTFSTVAPDGKITFPYIGNVLVKGRTVAQVQEEIQARLADGYMKYPVVAVALKESRSRKFFVYGEVLKPGSYPIEENMTVLRAISMAGGFSRFGSSSRVKVLRPRKDGPGYDTLKINVNAVMKGNASEDLLLSQGDIVVISEGMF
ncbi:polysaccharide export protein [bacterium]|nr:polysaccharide export protein [bacterium]